MATNVQQFLTNLEITPPPGAWSAIADRLQSEYDASAILVAQKLEDMAVMPPSAAWENIAAALPAASEPLPQITAPAKVVRLPYRRVRMLAAAVVVGLIGLTSWYFLNYEGVANSPTVVQQQQVTAPVSEPKVATESNNLPLPVPQVDADQIQLAEETTQPVTNYQYTRQASHAASAPRMYYRFDDQPMATTAGMPQEEATRFTSDVSPTVEGPLIRDANGNIIMDKHLITSPDNCYITITGPNGQQTRISSKFVDIISSLNTDTEPHTYFELMMQDNNPWHMRFREWRNKMMNHAAFIPSATNFMDILELKEMLQENQ